MEKKTLVLELLDIADIVELWNTFVYENRWENPIFVNDQEGLELVFGNNLMEVVRSISFGDYDYFHEYFSIDVYNNIRSYQNKYDLLENIDVDELTTWYLENPHLFSEGFLKDIKDRLEQEQNEFLEKGGE
jgi:hypothetical protein